MMTHVLTEIVTCEGTAMAGQQQVSRHSIIMCSLKYTRYRGRRYKTTFSLYSKFLPCLGGIILDNNHRHIEINNKH